MKCPNCNEEMRTVEIEYNYPPEVYVLDEKTQRYVLQVSSEELDDDDETFSLHCGECGCELEEHILDTFTNLIESW